MSADSGRPDSEHVPALPGLHGREYLQSVRPEAMGHLLAFFKESGRHLDPKTRFLISVLKQVVNFSPRGLRQYIRRAREAGATRDEVIDVILLAYPLANLTRMCDAVDVLLEMEARDAGQTAPPSVRPAASAASSPTSTSSPTGAPAPSAPTGPAATASTSASAEPQWHRLPGAAAPAEGGCAHGIVDGREVLVTRQGGVLHAIDDRCPHQGGMLHAGTVSDGVVTCPLHKWSFRLSDGGAAGRGLGGAKTHPVRATPDGGVEVRV